MKSYKALLNSLSNDSSLRQLTDEEVKKLRAVFLDAYRDLDNCCKKHGLTVMLIGGSVLGAVRHNGFIPWDDDLDVAMPRADFEKLKKIFRKELGDKYILSSPNYKNNANNRFPMMLVKGTELVEAENSKKSKFSKIKIDIFLIDNVPENKLIRYAKGAWCSLLMLIASYEDSYEKNTKTYRDFMCKTADGRKVYNRRIRLGRLFSFLSFQQWVNIVDKSFRYNKKTSLMGIPSGRKHYFGEVRPAKTFLPAAKGEFEGMTVNIPADANDYLTNLYGADYMTLPPEEKRERHFITYIKFKEN